MGSAPRNVVIRARPCAPYAEREVEICEHKGIGHPDSIMDGACEAVACALAGAYEQAFGRVLHFNVDKGLLVAGKSAPHLGGGKLVEPATLTVCGRAAGGGQHFDVDELARAAVDDFLRRSLRADRALFRVAPAIKAGSASLAAICGTGGAVHVANDTSFGAGFAPYSRLEQQVLQLAAVLRSSQFHGRFPAAGDDFKIMGLRHGAALHFTVAIAMIDRHVATVAQYFELKHAIEQVLAQALPGGPSVQVNALDDPGARDESGLYLTVTGLSAEMGDDGQTGRGNRVSGLITPGRAMSLEAAAGKNPLSHVGKIYNVLAHRIAGDIVAGIAAVEEADVQLLSTIGQALDRPQMALVEAGPAAALSAAVTAQIAQIVNRRLDHVAALTGELAHGLIDVYAGCAMAGQTDVRHR
jgi:S-adenosylmethionine synthetase